MFTSTFNPQGGIELGGIYVKTMAPEGPAALSGKINIGALIYKKSIFILLLIIIIANIIIIIFI